MNEPFIVICDDDPLMRDSYRRELSLLDGFEIATVEHPDYLLPLMRSLPLVAVLLMDLEFPISPGSDELKAIGHRILPDVRREFPNVKIVVVTKLGSAVYPVIMDSSRQRLHDDWVDVEKGLRGQELRARVEGLLYPNVDLGRNGFWIIQMSDLHFGAASRFGFPGHAEDGALLDFLCHDLLKQLPQEIDDYRVPHLILICGDSTHRARDVEYDQAANFLCSLREKLLRSRGYGGLWPQPELIVLPGNHDVNWDISRARCLSGSPLQFDSSIGPDTIPDELKYLKKYCWAPFERFIQKCGSRMPTFDRFWSRDSHFLCGAWQFPLAGLSVLGINSCARQMNHFVQEPHISPRQVEELSEYLESQGVKDGLPRILLVHHPLGSVSRDSDTPNFSEIQSLRSNLFRKLGAQISLTGHIHTEVSELISVGNTSLLYIGAGSVAQGKDRSSADLLHYNLLRLKPHSVGDSRPAEATIFSRVFFRDSFVENPNSKPQRYIWREHGGWYLA